MPVWNFEKVNDLIGNTGENHAPDPHTARVRAITAEMPAEDRPKRFFDASIAISPNIPQNEPYLAEMIEAALIAHYDEAEAIIGAFRGYLLHGAANAHTRTYYPAAIRALLRVCDQAAVLGPEKPGLSSSTAAYYVGALFSDMITYSEEADPVPSNWVGGQISDLLHKFLTTREIARSMVSAIGDIWEVKGPLRQVGETLSHRIFGMLTFQEKIELLRGAFKE
jgi:hypothetical protein